MLNIHELERSWLKYKIRSFIPAVMAVITTLVLLVAAIIVWPIVPTETMTEPATEAKKPAVTSKPIEASVLPIATEYITSEPVASSQPVETATKPMTAKPQVEEKSSPIVLKPSLQFMHAIEEEVQPYYENEAQPETAPAAPSKKAVVFEHQKPVEQPVPKPAEIVMEKSGTAPEETPKKVSAPVEEKARITIITKEDANDLKDVLRRFSKNKNPALSLFVAKRYYDMKLYEKAYNYALITNEIDNDIEESWMIFAKSLVKLDQKEKAQATLKSYIGHSHSMEAKRLLEDIQQGRFK